MNEDIDNTITIDLGGDYSNDFPTMNDPSLSATGADTDVDLTLTPRGSGSIFSGYSISTSAGMNGTSGQYLTSSSAGNTIWTTNSTSPWGIGNTGPGTMQVNGDAVFEGKVMINGRNISEFLETISKRLAILVPDPAKLEHFAALKKAYDHYKTLEALCELPKEESKD